MTIEIKNGYLEKNRDSCSQVDRNRADYRKYWRFVFFPKVIAFILVLFIFSPLAVFAQDNPVLITYNKYTYQMGTLQGDLVEVKNLKKILDFEYKTGSDTSFILVNGIRYDQGVTFRYGTYFVPLEKFLRFFLAVYKKPDRGVYEILNPGILNLSNIQEVNPLVVPGKLLPKKMSVVAVNKLLFIDASAFARYTGKLLDINGVNGTVTFNEKPVDRWIEKDGKVYLSREDLESAYGSRIVFAKPVSVKKNEKLEKEMAKAEEIRENIQAYFENERQYGTNNPKYPVGYRISITVRNRYRDPIKVYPSTMIIVDRKGNRHTGDILSSSGLTSSGTFIDDRIITPGAVPLNYFNIQPRDQGHLLLDFILPRGVEPAFFLFEYEGVLIYHKRIMRTYIP